MSIIQDIRDKYAKLTVVLIALALVGFILTDYFAGKSRGMVGGPSNTVGVVNGKKILFEDFSKKVTQAEENMKAQGYPPAAASQQALDQAWSQEINQAILSDEFEKLGIAVGRKELGDILYGQNAPQDIKQQFTDEKTGQFNAALAKQNIDQKLKSGTAEEKANINAYINQLVNLRMADKFFSLMSGTINFPKWMIEKQNAENAQMARISLVRETYASIPDSSIKVEDSEIEAFVNKNKKLFKQAETRSISFVSFSAAPSAKDSAATLSSLVTLRDRFASSDSVAQFLAGEGAQYFDAYVSGNAIQIPVKDSIFKLPVGGVYGPYLDANSYVLAKMIGVRVLPDSVKCRHVLVSNNLQQGGVDDSIASRRIDSIKLAINGGANWDSMVQKYNPPSDASRQNKGEMTFSSTEIQGPNFAREFGQFILLDGKVGERKVVKTSFGYHFIEIMSAIKPSTHYKVAYLPKEIIASQETDNAALNEANSFAAESTDLKSFDDTYEKKLKAKGFQKGIATDILRASTSIRGLENASRSFVRDIYAAKRGEVLKPERVDNSYVVAVVTEALEEGTMSTARARAAGAETEVRVKKKGELLKKKIGTVTTLEDAIAKLGGLKQIEPIDSLRIYGSNLSYEPKVIGAAFNPANKGKVVPEVLVGKQGVYVIRVEDQSSTAVPAEDINAVRLSRYQQAKQSLGNQYSQNNPLTILRNAADIKDKRSERF
ncbi:MAG TPA: SurA N-terminal domain-containing protein [Chitinophagaceae bacterium]|nr:SurA N-terminal domain-containing protein [Chitinophagaceae bacterium]HPH31868.1 SurA N-terminal domain-containing protein [Chitinophagaceae bacterium]HPN59606.1 SurA N-terminal domain-containing protein [Chitinophagaceae bacterium]